MRKTASNAKAGKSNSPHYLSKESSPTSGISLKLKRRIMQETLTCLSEERHVKPIASPVCDRDSQTREETSHSNLPDWLAAHAPAGSAGRMSPEFCRVGKDAILPVFSPCFAAGKCPYQNEDGVNPELRPPLRDVIPWHGEYLTLNTSEHNVFTGPFPNGDGVSCLSDIVEIGNIPPKYWLSRMACLGILRRAERRGRALPEPLRRALEAQVQKNSN